MRKEKQDSLRSNAEKRRQQILSLLKQKSPQSTQELKAHFADTCLSSFRNDLGSLKQRKKIGIVKNTLSPLVWEYLRD